MTQTDFNIVKPYSIASDGDITAIEVNTFKTKTKYEYIAVPVLDEAVFLTAILTGWESYDLLPGEASVYFKGNYAGKTALDPYGVSKELKISLGTDPKISVKRQQRREFKSKNLTGSNRVLDRTYDLEIKNNKSNTVNIRLLDRVPLSQNKEIKVNNIETPNAQYDEEKGILTWSLKLTPGQTQKESFSFQVKYPKGRRILL